MIHGAIVLEGGALRGVYTSGVLDVLQEHQLELECAAGVSAGALNALGYVSHQPGWAAKINLEYAHDPRYLGVRPLVKSHSLFGYDFMFGEISEQLIPFNYEAFYSSPQRYVAVATNCLTGEPAFFERGKCVDIMRAARASASIPLIAPFVRFAGVPYLDGGIALSAPVDWALEQGYDKVVAVLTRNKGFRKPPVSRGQQELSEVRYRRYPNLIRAMNTNPLRYNRQMAHFDELEAQGKIFIIRPQWPITISSLERDTLRLRLLYEQGRKEAEALLPALQAYLES